MTTSSNLVMVATMESMAEQFCRTPCGGFGAIMKNNPWRFGRRFGLQLVLFGIAFTAASIRAQNLAGDMALSLVLIDSEKWEVVASGYQFTDAACADADGNFYFTDVARGTNIFKVSHDGKVLPFISNAPKVSGLK